MNNNNADDRRKLQNREAQRCFRDRRQQKLQECEKELSDLRNQKNESTKAFQNQILDLQRRQAEDRQTINSLSERNAFLERQHASLEEKLRQLEQKSLEDKEPTKTEQHSSLPSPSSLEDDMDYATDFTLQFAKSKNTSSLYGTAGHCGFCDDTTACACKMAAAAATPIEPPVQRNDPTITLPGGCDRCLNDPEQAARCRGLAKYAHFNAGSSRDVSSVTAGSSPSTGNGKAIDCSTFLTKIGDKQLPQLQSVMRNIHPRPYSQVTGTYTGTHLPAMELDENEAAAALAEMANGAPAPGTKT